MFLRRQFAAELLAAAGYPRLDGADRRAHRLGDLLVRETLDVAHHDRHALVRRQPQQRLLYRRLLLAPQRLGFGPGSAVGDVDRVVAARRRRVQRDGGPPDAAPQLVGAGVRAMRISHGRNAPPERANAPKRREKCVLRRIFRRRAAAEHTETEVVDGALVEIDERVEGVEIAVPGAANEVRFAIRAASGGSGAGFPINRADSNKVPGRSIAAAC